MWECHLSDVVWAVAYWLWRVCSALSCICNADMWAIETGAHTLTPALASQDKPRNFYDK